MSTSSKMFSPGIVAVGLLFGIGNVIGSTCPNWVPFNGSSYCFNDNEQSWSNATKTCQEFGGGLAVPNFKEEQTFIFKMFKENVEYDYKDFKNIPGLWLDCSLAADGEWVYNDGTPCEYNAWLFWKKPKGDDGSCTIISRSSLVGIWVAAGCGDLQFSICESATEAAGNHLVSSAMVCLQADTNSRFASHCLTGHVIKELPIKGVVACGSACRDEPRCSSFNVRLGSSEEQICQFNDVTREEAEKEDIEMDNSCYYFDI